MTQILGERVASGRRVRRYHGRSVAGRGRAREARGGDNGRGRHLRAVVAHHDPRGSSSRPDGGHTAALRQRRTHRGLKPCPESAFPLL